MGLFNLSVFRDGPHDQFERLASPHLDRLYKYAYRLCGNRDDAEDLVQDLLLKLYPRLEEMKGIDKLGAWMARILYRMYIDRLRRDKRSPLLQMEDEEAVYETYASTHPGPLDTVDSDSTLTIINEALQRLSDDHRLLIILHDVEGHNLQEIHEITGLPLGTIKSRISRARNKLREIISKKEPYVLESVKAGTRL